MGSAAKFGLLILMALVIALARFLEGEVKPRRVTPPSMSVAQALINGQRTNTSRVVPDNGQGQTTNLARPGINPNANQGQAPQPNVRPKARAAPVSSRTYKALKRDTLGRISKKMYGTTRHWKEILKANKKELKGNEKGLKPGMKLVIPNIKKKKSGRR
jgi:nucleoid-associated protein YgaU